MVAAYSDDLDSVADVGNSLASARFLRFCRILCFLKATLIGRRGMATAVASRDCRRLMHCGGARVCSSRSNGTVPPGLDELLTLFHCRPVLLCGVCAPNVICPSGFLPERVLSLARRWHRHRVDPLRAERGRKAFALAIRVRMAPAALPMLLFFGLHCYLLLFT